MAAISLKDVSKRYPRGVEAVNNVNLRIADGEFLVLVGPSGCGKSTTLRMIAGLESVSCGEIFIGDRKVNDVEPGKRDIAMVFQDYALYPHMTVRQNLSFGLRTRKFPRDEINRCVASAASILSIETLLDCYPRELSGGQRQRVALGRAIVRDPQAFLFDEPLANLDAKLRVQMRTEIARLHDRLQTTIVYVTHDQVEAMTLGERIAIMKDGVLQQVDMPMNLYRQPANQFVAGFIGSPTMNFLCGRVTDGVFRCGNSLLSLPTNVSSGEVILGVRPEDLVLDQTQRPFANVTVDVVEHLGHETMVYFEIEQQQWIARLPPSVDPRAHETIQLAVRADSLHWFQATDPHVRIG